MSMPLPPPAGPTLNWPLIARESAAIIYKHGMLAVLRRNGIPDRWVKVFLRRYTAREMQGGLYDPLERFAMVAAPVAPPPDYQLDRLITFVQPLAETPVEDENLRVISAPEKIAPGGIVAFWKLRVRA